MRVQTRGRLHPLSRCVIIHGTGLASCHAMNLSVVQISFVQGPEDAVADLLPNDAQTQQSAGETAHPSFDDTALTEHAKLLLGNIVQKYHSNTSHRWRRVLEGLYLPVRIREELRRPDGLARPGTLLDQVD